MSGCSRREFKGLLIQEKIRQERETIEKVRKPIDIQGVLDEKEDKSKCWIEN